MEETFELGRQRLASTFATPLQYDTSIMLQSYKGVTNQITFLSIFFNREYCKFLPGHAHIDICVWFQIFGFYKRYFSQNNIFILRKFNEGTTNIKYSCFNPVHMKEFTRLIAGAGWMYCISKVIQKKCDCTEFWLNHSFGIYFYLSYCYENSDPFSDILCCTTNYILARLRFLFLFCFVALKKAGWFVR